MAWNKCPDAAKPYTNVFSKDIVDCLMIKLIISGPAGSMVSCVNDLSHWLMMQLDSGRYNGKQILTLGGCSAHKGN
jgi:hypothetical protein